MISYDDSFYFNLCCRFVQMDGLGFYTNILTSDSEHIPGLNDFAFPVTPQSQVNSNAMPHDSQEDVVELQATDVGATRTARKGLSHRSKKFDQEEDKIICVAWCKVSKDPIHGANQRQATFWSRVRAYFDEHKKSSVARTENSIMHRWGTIQKEVNKFCAAYDKTLRRNASGKTIQDMVQFQSLFFCYIFHYLVQFTYLNIFLYFHLCRLMMPWRPTRETTKSISRLLSCIVGIGSRMKTSGIHGGLNKLQGRNQPLRTNRRLPRTPRRVQGTKRIMMKL